MLSVEEEVFVGFKLPKEDEKRNQTVALSIFDVRTLLPFSSEYLRHPFFFFSSVIT